MFFEGAFVFVIDALLAQVIFESAALVAPSAKIAEPGGAKKVGRSGREGPKIEKQRFDWKFPIGGPEKGDFFPFFGVFDPLGKSRRCRRPPAPPPQGLHETAVFDEKRDFA